MSRVFLLDVGLIIFVIRTGACHLHRPFPARKMAMMMIHKFASIVGIRSGPFNVASKIGFFWAQLTGRKAGSPPKIGDGSIFSHLLR